MQLLMAAILAGAPAPPPPVDYRFEIRRAEGLVHNPWTLSGDKVELRSFVGSGAMPGAFVAPTIRVSPGQKLAVALDNRLEACSDEQWGKHQCFNDTNLHTHGLWVSPAGKSDNVLIAIKPGERFRYEYDIPADHPAGTFWYHPHRHGGGFVQVGSGMAGALIVTGDRKPTAGSPGDIDILLKDSKGRALDERVMLFQQIQYGCLDAKGEIVGRKDEEDDYVRPWTCAPGEVGRIEGFEHDWDWVNSGRFTGINGKVQPLLAPVRAGAFERWRLIHGGTRERIRMRLHRLDPAAPALGSVRGGDQEQWLARYCAGERLPFWHIAMDGLTRSAVRRSDEAVLFPGDRMDVLVRLPAAGGYCLVQDATARKDRPQPRRVLAMIEATGADSALDGDSELASLLAAAARRALSGRGDRAIRERVLADLADGMKLSAFVWHKPIREEDVSGYREATLSIVETPKAALFHVNGRPYDHERIDHELPLGKAEEWRAASLLGGHPLHIHVNPFQIISINDHQARDVTDPDGPAFDPDYAGLKGEWKDTVFIKENHRVAFRTRYERFTGDFVIHCHIMFHGDHGMMQNLRIAGEGEAPRPFGQDGH